MWLWFSYLYILNVKNCISEFILDFKTSFFVNPSISLSFSKYTIIYRYRIDQDPVAITAEGGAEADLEIAVEIIAGEIN